MSLLEDLESLYKAAQEHFIEYHMDVPENLESAFMRLRNSLKKDSEIELISPDELEARIEKLKLGLKIPEKDKKPLTEEETKKKVQYFIKATSFQELFLKMLEKSVPVESVAYEFGIRTQKVIAVVGVERGVERKEYDYGEITKGMEDWSVKANSFLED